MNTLKAQQKFFIAAGNRNEVYNTDLPPIDTPSSDPKRSLHTEPQPQNKPFRPKGTKPETVRYIKDIVVTGLHWILSPLL